MDRYFYFRDVADEANDSDDGASCMIPVRNITGIGPGTSITIQTRPAFNYLEYGFKYSIPGCAFATAHCNAALGIANVDDGSCQFHQIFFKDSDGDGYLDVEWSGECDNPNYDNEDDCEDPDIRGNNI